MDSTIKVCIPEKYSNVLPGNRASLGGYLSEDSSSMNSDLSCSTHSNSTVETAASSEESSPSCEGRRRISWSDHLGRELTTIHSLCDDLEQATVRVVVVLMHAKQKKFEFVHCEYSTEDSLLVSDVLAQLPYTSVQTQWPVSAFKALLRESTGQELLSGLDMSSFGLRDGEILIAVSPGSKARDCVRLTQRILTKHNKFFRKSIKKARIQGRALQCLYPSTRWIDVAAAGDRTVPTQRFARQRKSKRPDGNSNNNNHNNNLNSTGTGYKSSDDEGLGGSRHGSKGTVFAKGGFLSRKMLREYERKSQESELAKKARRKRREERNKKVRKRRKHFPMVIEWYRNR